MMKNKTTLIIQGKVVDEPLRRNIELYQDVFNIVISTWNDDVNRKRTEVISSFSDIDIIYNKVPPSNWAGPQNFYLQTTTTLAALNIISTPYVIKMRGDETYTNLEMVENQIISYSDKIWFFPIFFRSFSFLPYHISDHVIAGKTENIYKMFSAAHSNDSPRFEPETNLTRAYMQQVGFHDFDNQLIGKQKMKELFGVMSLTPHRPYTIMQNSTNRVWQDEFDHHETISITNMDDL